MRIGGIVLSARRPIPFPQRVEKTKFLRKIPASEPYWRVNGQTFNAEMIMRHLIFLARFGHFRFHVWGGWMGGFLAICLIALGFWFVATCCHEFFAKNQKDKEQQ